MAAILDFNGRGRLGRETNFYRGRRSTVKNEERGGGRGVTITSAEVISPLPAPPPTPYTLTANQNMAGRTNDRKL